MLEDDASPAVRVEIIETAVTTLFETLPKGTSSGTPSSRGWSSEVGEAASPTSAGTSRSAIAHIPRTFADQPEA